MILLTSYQFIKPLDFIVAPILFFCIVFFGFIYSKKKYRDKKIRKYFRYGLILKLLGSLAVGLIYQYVFGYGDTYYYHSGATSFSSNFFTNFQMTAKLLWNDSAYNYAYIGSYFRHVGALVARDSSLFVMKVGGILGLFTFSTYLGTSLLFATFAFAGSWKIFKVFYDLYPQLHKQIAISTLYIPSVILWGAGFMKDPIVMGALGYLFHSSYMLFFKRKSVFKYGIICFISSYVIIIVKVYVFLAFFPALAMWIILNYKNKIRNSTLRGLIMPFAILLIGIFGITGYSSITSIDKFKVYSLENVAGNAHQMVNSYNEINLASEESGKGSLSNFSIGTFEPTLFGMLKLFPQAVSATLYRPYIWEAGSLFNLLSALENTVFLFFTLYILLKRKIIYFIRDILRNADTFFCLTFVLILAFMVGISTANFGTLVRYKIPCLPFFLMALFIIQSRVKKH